MTASTATAAIGVRRRRRHWREYGLFVLFAFPNIAIIAIFALWPTLYNVVLSMLDWDMISPEASWVGLKHYQWLLTSREFVRVLQTTLVFTVAVVGINMVGGLGLALLLNQPLRGRDVARTLAFAPHVLSGAAVATVWMFLLDPNFGLSRVVFDAFAASSPQWLTSSRWALTAIVVVHVWKGLGFAAIIYLAALQGLPQDLYEAAEIDGAGAWRRFRVLTLPLLSPTTFFLLIISIIGTSQAFDVIAVMTGGGPGSATTILSWFIYEQGFQSFNVGRAAAGAIVLFLALAVLTVLQRVFLERKVHYQ